MTPENEFKSAHGYDSSHRNEKVKRSQSLTGHLSKHKRTYSQSKSWGGDISRKQSTSTEDEKNYFKMSKTCLDKSNSTNFSYLKKEKDLPSLNHSRRNNYRYRFENRRHKKKSKNGSNNCSDKSIQRCNTGLEIQKDSFSLDHLRGYTSRNRLENRLNNKYSTDVFNRFSVESDRAYITDHEEDEKSFLFDICGFRIRNTEDNISQNNLTPHVVGNLSPNKLSPISSNDSYNEYDQWSLRKDYSNISSPKRILNETKFEPNFYKTSPKKESTFFNLYNDIVTDSSYFSYLRKATDEPASHLDIFKDYNDSALRDLKDANLLNQSYINFFDDNNISFNDIKKDDSFLDIGSEIKKNINQIFSTNSETQFVDTKFDSPSSISYAIKMNKEAELFNPKLNDNRDNTRINIHQESTCKSISASKSTQPVKNAKLESNNTFTIKVKSDNELLIPKCTIKTEFVSTMSENQISLPQADENVDNFQENITNYNESYTKKESQDILSTQAITENQTSLLPKNVEQLLNSKEFQKVVEQIHKDSFSIKKENLENITQNLDIASSNPINRNIKLENKSEDVQDDLDLSKSHQFDPLDLLLKEEGYDPSYFENLNYSWPTELDDSFS